MPLHSPSPLQKSNCWQGIVVTPVVAVADVAAAEVAAAEVDAALPCPVEAAAEVADANY